MGGDPRPARRAFVEDARGGAHFLRISWHGDRRQFVVSNWDGAVCVGATRVRVEDAPAIVEVVTAGLADAARDQRPPDAAAQPESLLEHLRTWWYARGRVGRARPAAGLDRIEAPGRRSA